MLVQAHNQDFAKGSELEPKVKNFFSENDSYKRRGGGAKIFVIKKSHFNAMRSFLEPFK